MGLFSPFPLTNQEAFLYTLGTTSAVAFSVMITRYFNVFICILFVICSDGTCIFDVLAAFPQYRKSNVFSHVKCVVTMCSLMI